MKHGLFGYFEVEESNFDQLLKILKNAGKMMQGSFGCEIYSVHIQESVRDKIFVYEVWVDQDHHQKALELPEVRRLIAEARPLISGVGEQRIFLVP